MGLFTIINSTTNLYNDSIHEDDGVSGEDVGLFSSEDFGEKDESISERIETINRITESAWESNPNISNLMSYKELLSRVKEIRLAEGSNDGIPLLTSIFDSFFGIRNRISTVLNLDEGEEARKIDRNASYLIPSFINTSNSYPIVNFDISDRYAEMNIAGMSIDHINEAFGPIYAWIIGETITSPTDSQIDEFTGTLSNLFNDEWFICTFCSYMAYKAFPLSPVIANFVVGRFEDEEMSKEGAVQSYDIVEELKAFTSHGDRVLDAGTGVGISANTMAKGLEGSGVFVIAIDRLNATAQNRYYGWSNRPSDGLIRNDQIGFFQNNPMYRDNLRFVEGSLTHNESGLPFVDSSFDVVVLGSVLKHMTSETGFKVSAEVLRVLKSDGIALVQEATDMGPNTIIYSKDPLVADLLQTISQLGGEPNGIDNEQLEKTIIEGYSFLSNRSQRYIEMFLGFNEFRYAKSPIFKNVYTRILAARLQKSVSSQDEDLLASMSSSNEILNILNYLSRSNQLDELELSIGESSLLSQEIVRVLLSEITAVRLLNSRSEDSLDYFLRDQDTTIELINGLPFNIKRKFKTGLFERLDESAPDNDMTTIFDMAEFIDDLSKNAISDGRYIYHSLISRFSDEELSSVLERMTINNILVVKQCLTAIRAKASDKDIERSNIQEVMNEVDRILQARES